MTAVYGFLADALVVVHLAFIGFVGLGGFLVLRWHWLAWEHLPCVTWGVLVEWFDLVCPLTPWEQRLRHLADHPGYDGGFIEHYLAPILYPPDLTRPTQVLLGGLVVAINVAVYARLWHLRRH